MSEQTCKYMLALHHLNAIKEKLDAVQEKGEEFYAISNRVLELENQMEKLKEGEKTVAFSDVTEEDLQKAGIIRKTLCFKPAKVAELAKGLTTNMEAEIINLHSQISRVCAYVDMSNESASLMILNAILLIIPEIASTQQRNVAILPEIEITQYNHYNDVQISHPISGYKLGLSGNIDNVIIEYEDVKEEKDRLLALGGSRRDALKISKGHLIFVKFKGQGLERSLLSYIPEAVSQGIALLRSTNLSEIRFCLSDGQNWIFYILKSKDGTITYYESVTRQLKREDSDLPLREIVQLVCEWLRPTMTDLFILESSANPL